MPPSEGAPAEPQASSRGAWTVVEDPPRTSSTSVVSPRSCALPAPTSSSALPARPPVAAEPLMGAEDFSYVLHRVPGAMAFLGACPPGADPASAAGNHSNLVVFDEDALPTGAALYAAMALDALAT